MFVCEFDSYISECWLSTWLLLLKFCILYNKIRDFGELILNSFFIANEQNENVWVFLENVYSLHSNIILYVFIDSLIYYTHISLFMLQLKFRHWCFIFRSQIYHQMFGHGLGKIPPRSAEKGPITNCTSAHWTEMSSFNFVLNIAIF